MGVLNIAFPPAAIGALVTGVLLSLGTRWGPLQHYWVATKLALSVGVIVTGIALVGPPIPTVHLRAVGAGGGRQHDTRDRIGADDSSDPCRWPTRSCWGLRQLSLCTSHGARRGSVGARGCDRRKEGSSEMLGGDPRMDHAMRDRLTSSPMYAWSWDRQNRDSHAPDGSSTTLERCG